MNHIFRRSINKGRKENDGRKPARANLSIVAVLSILVMFTATAMAAQPPTSFHVYGGVKYNNGTNLLGPNVTVTNLNSTEVFTAETNASYNYYQLVTASWNVSARDVLRFNATDNDNSVEFNVTVTVENMTNGGLFEQNIVVPIGGDVDIVISDVWVCWPDNCTICYNLTNTGSGTVPAGHNTTLYVDGNETAYDIVSVAIAPNASVIRCFSGYSWTYTTPEDNITVCADNNKTVAENNETNNCLTNIWMCGDVRKDGYGLYLV
jgi:hypothetical protein